MITERLEDGQGQAEGEDEGVAAAALRRLVGDRMRQARILNGFQQGQAAARLGYEQGSQLSLFESGIRMPPMKVLIDASRLYSVTTDYLLGMAADPDEDARVAARGVMLRHVDDIVQSAVGGITDILSKHLQTDRLLHDEWRELERLAERAVASYERMREMNREVFDEYVRGGATADLCVNEFKAAMERHAPAMREAFGIYQRAGQVIADHVKHQKSTIGKK